MEKKTGKKPEKAKKEQPAKTEKKPATAWVKEPEAGKGQPAKAEKKQPEAKPLTADVKREKLQKRLEKVNAWIEDVEKKIAEVKAAEA